MGEAITTFCYKCKTRTDPLFLGRGKESEEEILPGLCFNCKQIEQFHMSKPICSKCNHQITPIGEFVLRFIHERDKPRNMKFYIDKKFLNNNPFGISFSGLLEKTKISRWRKIRLKYFKKEQQKALIQLLLNLDEYYRCPSCNSNNLKIMNAGVYWD